MFATNTLASKLCFFSQNLVFQGINNKNVSRQTLTGTKIDGKVIAQSVKEIVKKAVDELKTQNVTPCLATVLVGDNTASATYVRNKHKACDEVGITTKDHKLESTISQNELNQLIDDLNNDITVHGILVQLPLPKQLNEFEIISRISPVKDVDGLTPYNAGLLSMKKAMRSLRVHHQELWKCLIFMVLSLKEKML